MTEQAHQLRPDEHSGKTEFALEFRAAGVDFTAPNGEPVAAVASLDLAVRRAETLCIIGTSGCGKTTLIKMVNRLVDLSRGDVLFEGVSVRDQPAQELRLRMGYVIQSGGLFPHMHVERNVGLLAELAGWSPDRISERVRTLLRLVHLDPDEVALRRPSQLSGGQRQRVGVARALLMDPPLLLMDEPFGALDNITRTRLRREFKDLKETTGQTTLLVTHDLREAFELGDRVALLDAGQLCQVGTEEDFRDRPEGDFVQGFVQEHFG